jgi:hypothetical protein
MKKLLGLSTLISLLFASLTLVAAPAQASAAADDATLASISLGGWTRINGDFNPSLEPGLKRFCKG